MPGRTLVLAGTGCRIVASSGERYRSRRRGLLTDMADVKNGGTVQNFVDRFGARAADYATFRPAYPAELFAHLAGIVPRRDLAWDCGTGSGQAARSLAAHFARVVATDASAAQIGAAAPHRNVEYRIAPAEASGLADASVDLCTVAQALHWFDLDRFYTEVRRVLAPGGLLAVWTYAMLAVDDEPIDRIVQHFYSETVGPYWPRERRLVESGYEGLPFPFREIRSPAFAMRTDWSLDMLLGYVRTWSAVSTYVTERGGDPVEPLAEALLPLWGSPERRRRMYWPLSVRIGAALP